MCRFNLLQLQESTSPSSGIYTTHMLNFAEANICMCSDTPPAPVVIALSYTQLQPTLELSVLPVYTMDVENACVSLSPFACVRLDKCTHTYTL